MVRPQIDSVRRVAAQVGSAGNCKP